MNGYVRKTASELVDYILELDLNGIANVYMKKKKKKFHGEYKHHLFRMNSSIQNKCFINDFNWKKEVL